jgi:ABC-type nitrate/sulfonate/bicarbonate transport system substrate-binding protein
LSEKNPQEAGPLVAEVTRAVSEALHFIKTNKEETKALIAKNLKTNDPEGLERAYRDSKGQGIRDAVDLTG